MKVHWDQAYKWERQSGDADHIVEYFTRERTKAWEERRREYWARQVGVISNDEGAHQLELCRRARIGSEFHYFLDLPREIRDMIYAYLLVHGSVFLRNYPHGVDDQMDADKLTCFFTYRDYRNNKTYIRYRGIPQPWKGLSRPETPIGLICGVSKEVQREAAAIYYGRNRFVYPYGACNIPAVCPGGSPKTFDLLRDVSLTFDKRHVCISPHSRMYEYGHRRDNIDNPRSYLRRRHRRYFSELKSKWGTMISRVKQLALDRLQLSFEECYCPMGCCRMVTLATSYIVPGNGATQWNDHPPKTIEIVGWDDEYERQYIVEEFEKLRIGDAPVKLRFLGKSNEEVNQELKAARRL
ncbi:hypothetical protein F5Y05DRAFT_371833 [Hypoxylon sp. FL0543]|nr:hypothetical protein F5Y05DRAFT_371833 [Hypoxylon sp. FL0543]